MTENEVVKLWIQERSKGKGKRTLLKMFSEKTGKSQVSIKAILDRKDLYDKDFDKSGNIVGSIAADEPALEVNKISSPRYVVCEGESRGALSEEVNNYLERGYELVGGVGVANMGLSLRLATKTYVQAVVIWE